MPPKQKRSESLESPFLFVNEDASTVKRTTKDAQLDRTKQSHVQRQNFMRKRRLQEEQDAQRQTSSVTSASSSPAPVAPSTEIPSASTDVLLRGQSYFDSRDTLDMEGDMLPTSNAQHSFDALDPRLFADPYTSQSPSPATSMPALFAFDSPQTHPPGRFLDGFSSHQIISASSRGPMSTATSSFFPSRTITSPPNADQRLLELWAPILIQHYNTVILPERFWLDTRKISMSQIRHAVLIHADMQSCMAEPAHMYAFLANAATQMIAREGQLMLAGATQEELRNVPTLFKTKAIRALRSRLGNGYLDHRLAMDVHRLYSATIFNENPQAAEPHFQALLSMIDQLGGLDTFDDYQLETLIHTDCEAALVYSSVPKLVVNWDPGPLTDDQMHVIDAHGNRQSDAGSGFAPIFEFENIYLSDSDSFSDLVQVLDMSTHLMDLRDYDHEEQKWLSRRFTAMLSRLLTSLFCDDSNDTTTCLKIASILWIATSSSFQIRPRSRWSPGLTTTLRQKLQNTRLDQFWRPHAPVLLWVAVFGGICATDDLNIHWFSSLAKDVAGNVGVGNFGELEELLSTFLYDPVAHRDLLSEFSQRLWPSATAI